MHASNERPGIRHFKFLKTGERAPDKGKDRDFSRDMRIGPLPGNVHGPKRPCREWPLD
jgi:hypothetical protein